MTKGIKALAAGLAPKPLSRVPIQGVGAGQGKARLNVAYTLTCFKADTEIRVNVSYPIALNLAGRRCVIVGGGRVAARKARDLLASGAETVVISPALCDGLALYVQRNAITWHAEPYRVGLLAELQPILVFAATNANAVNRAIVEESRVQGIWVNVADHSASSDFENMAVVRHPPLMMALSTGGASPAMAAHLKHILSQVVGEEYATLTQWLGDLRPVVEAHIPDQKQRSELYWAIIHSNVLDHLQHGDKAAAKTEIAHILSVALA